MTVPHDDQFYDDQFYEDQRAGSRLSAEVIVPMARELVDPISVLDVGCGVGTWASVWIAAGLSDVIGVDGDYVNREMLEIPAEKFVGHDLTQPLDLGRRFDLVQCLEVAEHLPEDAAATLARTLARHADVVLFSAAIPGQSGPGHVNLQWPSYWAEHFGSLGFGLYDPFRARVWRNEDVEWWYRQNCVLFIATRSPLIDKVSPPNGPIDVVHPLLIGAEL